MSVNQEIAERLGQIAKLQDLLGEDRFKAISHDRAARAIESLSVDLASIANDRAALTAIDGIGPKIAEKIREYVATGTMTELEELRAKVPPGVLKLMEIPGLGPKTAAVLWKQGGVTSIAELKKAIDNGSLLSLPRMGEKSIAKLKESLALAEEGAMRLALGLATPVAEAIIAHLSKVKGVRQMAYAGSLRRGKETIGDIDILATADNPALVSETFRAMRGVRQIITAGDTRSSIRLAVDADLGRWELEGKEGDEVPAGGGGPTVQVDLRILPAASWGAALMYFTGSKEHNIRLRERALKRGYTLSEYGLFPEDGESTPPHQRGIKAVAGKSEEEVFRALGLEWIPPEMREASGEIEAFELESPAKSAAETDKKKTPARKGKNASKEHGLEAHDSHKPRPIELSDIQAELHAHTTASDGTMSIIALAEEAKRRGFHTIAVTDHSKSSVIANGLSVERLRAHVEAIHEARKRVRGITILAGSEVDILADGSLDYDDKTLALLDIVVASPHNALSQDPPTATKRLLKAIAHPRVNILGHPTGRLINRRAGLSPDMAQLIAAAVKHHVALEINAHWLRLDLRDVHVRAAADAGALIAIDCDVHAPDDYDNLRYGIATARRGWLPAAQCVNTWPAEKLHEWLESKSAPG